MIPILAHVPPLRQRLLVAHLAAAALAAHLLESTLPGLGPWFKPGLANLFTLTAYLLLGWRAALAVTLIRVLAGALALGSFLSPGFLLSLSGALAAVSVVGLAGSLPLGLGAVGLSLLASLAHMSAQMAVAWLVILRHDGLWLALPWFLMGSWFTGILNGVLAAALLSRLQPMPRWLEQP